jgi:protein-disulfide isomerase
MTRLLHSAIILLFVMLSPIAAQADVGEFPIKADDGTTIANHSVGADLVERIEKLQNIVVAANPGGKVTLHEFYDLNCPYCRKASEDIDALVRANKNLRLVLVPFPVLGIPSILAARVEYGVNKMTTPQEAYKFHRKVYEGRGTIEDNRAFAAAQAIGLDIVEVRAKASEEAFSKIMTEHVRLGDALGIRATPGLVIGGVAIVGYPGKAALTRVIAAVETCGKVIC